MHRLVLVLVAFAGCPCAGNQGVLMNAQNQPPHADARFVTEKATLIVGTRDGIRRVALDGSSSVKIFDPFPHKDVPSVTVKDVSSDGKTYVLSDSDTNLYVGDATTGRTFEIPQLRKRLSDAALSPDGTKIAATRHSDYDAPQSSAKEDDTVYVIDIATKQVTEIPAQSDNWPATIKWSADGKALWLILAWEKGSQWLTLADRRRVDYPYGAHTPAPLRVDPRKPPTCTQQPLVDKGPTLEIVDAPTLPARVLIKLEGRERGFHDYQADFSHAAMSPGCKFVVFQHRRKVWVVDLQGAAVGPVVEGSWLFFAP